MVYGYEDTRHERIWNETNFMLWLGTARVEYRVTETATQGFQLLINKRTVKTATF
jgi:hypothetical protein